MEHKVKIKQDNKQLERMFIILFCLFKIDS